MSDVKVPNEVKVVSWFIVVKNLIKFDGVESTYKLSDAVIKASNFEKYPIAKGDKVEVGIKDGVVTFLKKQKSDAPKVEPKGSEEAYEPTPEEEKPVAPKVEEPKPVPPPAPKAEADTRDLTIHGVAANKKVVKFIECKEDGWYQIAEAIQAQDYSAIGMVARNKVRVKIVEKTVVSIENMAVEATEQPKTATSSPETAKVEPTIAKAIDAPAPAPKKEWKPASSYDTAEKQTSIEAQAAVNSANEVAGQVAAAIATSSRKVNEDGSVTTNAPTANVINNIIRAIAEANFALIQELKAKQ